VAAVGVQRSRIVGKAHTGHRNRIPAPHSHPDFDRVRAGFFLLKENHHHSAGGYDYFSFRQRLSQSVNKAERQRIY
jgi:hypothetical protein